MAFDPTVAKQAWCLSLDRYDRGRFEHIYWFGQNFWHREQKWSLKNPGSIKMRQSNDLLALTPFTVLFNMMLQEVRWNLDKNDGKCISLHSDGSLFNLRGLQGQKKDLVIADGWATDMMLPFCAQPAFKLINRTASCSKKNFAFRTWSQPIQNVFYHQHPPWRILWIKNRHWPDQAESCPSFHPSGLSLHILRLTKKWTIDMPM